MMSITHFNDWFFLGGGGGVGAVTEHFREKNELLRLGSLVGKQTDNVQKPITIIFYLPQEFVLRKLEERQSVGKKGYFLKIKFINKREKEIGKKSESKNADL